MRITLLDACYLHGGLGERSSGPAALRDGDAERWAARVDELARRAGLRIGAAIHSVRAVDSGRGRVVAAWAASAAWPLHAHVSEQPAENEACLAAYGRTPTGVLAEAGALGPAFTAVHATHLTDDDSRCSAGRRTVCLARRPSATWPTASARRRRSPRPAPALRSAATRTR